MFALFNFTQNALGEDGVYGVIASCKMPTSLVDKALGYYPNYKNDPAKNPAYAVLQVKQYFPTGLTPVAPKVIVGVQAFNNEDKPLEDQKTLYRLAIQRNGATLAVSYDQEGSSVRGFLLTIGAEGGQFSIVRHVQTSDPVVSDSTEVDCAVAKLFRPDGFLGAVLKVLTGTNEEKANTIDSYVDGRAYGSTYEAFKKLGITEDEYKKILGVMQDQIVKESSGQECGKFNVRSVLAAKNIDAEVLGYRVDGFCSKILTKKDYTAEAIGASFYFGADGVQIDVKPRKVFTSSYSYIDYK